MNALKPFPILRGPRVALIAALAVTATMAVPPPVLAQDDESRIRKLEAEVRALQRRVFPGGDGRFFEPEIAAPASPASRPSCTPATTATTDMLARLDALERQIQALTARSEVNGNAMSLLTARIAALETGSAAQLADTGAAGQNATATPATPSQAAAPPAATPPAADVNLAAMTGGASASPAAATAAAAPSAQRIAAVRAIAKPQTDDAADDEYSYGFRLWDAGFYPEAQQQLAMFLEQHDDHWRATYARNLLGRAYLDASEPREAAPWFLQNYQADKTAARAGDSLLYLAEAMLALGDTNRACIALAEFGDTYPALASGRLAAQYQSNLARVDCD